MENYYEEGMPKVAIPLTRCLTPVQNSAYYTEYRKADTAEKKLVELIAQGEQGSVVHRRSDRLPWLGTHRSGTGRYPPGIGGRWLSAPSKGKGQKEEKLPPLRLPGPAMGLPSLCGRNNVQNDRLTLKESCNYDVVPHPEDPRPPHRGGQRRAGSAQLHFGGGCGDCRLQQQSLESTRVPVDYTHIKNVKSPMELSQAW